MLALQENELTGYAKLLKTKCRILSAEVKDYYIRHPIVISTTTSPVRLKKITTMLSIILTFPYISEVHINLPKLYRNSEPYSKVDIDYVKKFDKRIKIYRVSKDIGPLTKVLPAIERLKRKRHNNLIISVDDDIGYPISLFYELAYYSWKYPDCIFTGSGFLNYKEYKYYKKLDEVYWPKDDNEEKIHGCNYVNVVEGFGSISYNPKLFDVKLSKKLNSVSKSCKLSDDLTISLMLALNKVPRYVVKNKYYTTSMLLPFTYGKLEDALHHGSGLDMIVDNANIIKYIKCMKEISELIPLRGYIQN